MTYDSDLDLGATNFNEMPDVKVDGLLPGEITVDNEANANFTVLSLEMTDYPGLLRVVAWVLNGLSLLVENARCSTSQP